MWMTMLTFLIPGLGQATRGETRKAVQYFFTASGIEFAIGGTDTADRFKFCPWCGGVILNKK